MEKRQKVLLRIFLLPLQRDPDKVVQSCYDDGVDLTAGEMSKLASRLAKNLLEENLQIGNVVGLVAKNTTYVAPVVLGCMFIGCPISTLDPTFDVSEIVNIFQQTKPKLVFCDHDNFDVVTEALKRCENSSEIVTVDEKVEDARHVTEMFEISPGEREFVPQNLGVDSARIVSVILCSSGTTALSKGTMLSSAQCVELSRAFPQVVSPTLLSFSSLYWLSGLTVLLYTLMNVTKRVITKRKFSPLVMIHLIEQYNVNVIISAPSHVAMLVQSPALPLADLSSVRIFFVAGGFCAQHIRESLQDHLLYGTISVTYGMTETGTIIASTLPFQKPSNSVGKIRPNMQLKIVDDDGNAMDPGEIGEIYIKSPTLFLGYAAKPEETRGTFDVHGWLKTGDLGYFSSDGEIFVVDRKKEMIKYLNYQVAPSEIENCIMKFEGVKGVCVVGIPDILAGDLAAAVVVREPNSFLTEQDIIDEVARNFPQFKRLHGGAYFIESLPYTPSGKIKKRIVRKHAAQMYKSNEINGNY